jgi:hypothetical protein
MALEKREDIAILFRDTDGTQSTSPSNWKERAESIHNNDEKMTVILKYRD